MPSPRTALRARWTVVPGPSGALEAAEGLTVLVEGNRIVDVTRAPDGVAARVVEAPRGILLPGFVNLHNHALNGPIFRGIVDDAGSSAPADSIVYGLLLPLGDLAGRLLSEDDIRAVYRLALLEIIRSGITSVLDMPRAVHHGLFVVAKEMGLRLFGAPYVFSTPTLGLDAKGKPVYGPGDEDKSLDAALRVADAYDEGPGGRVRVGLGPHATDTCSPRLLRRIREEARERETFVSVHVAQSRIEVESVRSRHGRSPVELLHDAGLLGPDVVAAHCVYAEKSDLDLLRDTGTTVANCPLTFARSGVTVPFDRFHKHGVRTGVGTDAYSFDFFAELRAAGLLAKTASGDPGAVDAPTLLRAATEVGADALSRPDLGRIASGRIADLIVVDLGGPHVQPVRDPIRNLVWNATPADVRLVMVDGRILVHEGKVAGWNEDAIAHRATLAVERLWAAAQREGIL